MTPLPSLDLLILAGANGLMLQEMGRLWESPWSLEQLQAAGQELAKAALQRLAQARLEPTPENYARAYAIEAGNEPTPAANAPRLMPISKGPEFVGFTAVPMLTPVATAFQSNEVMLSSWSM